MTGFPDEPIFDYGPGEGPPFSGRGTVALVKPPATIAIVERDATLEKNPHFLCLGYRYEIYFFKPKKLDQRTMVIDTFSIPRILALAPLKFWKEWSGTEGKSLPRIMIMDALIRLAQRTGRYVYPHERWLAADKAARSAEIKA